jgi:hypothetical protein
LGSDKHVALAFYTRVRMRLALLRMERCWHIGQQLATLGRETASIFILRFAFPLVERKAFTALKPPFPHCASVSACTHKRDFRQKPATICETFEANCSNKPAKGGLHIRQT